MKMLCITHRVKDLDANVAGSQELGDGRRQGLGAHAAAQYKHLRSSGAAQRWKQTNTVT